MPTTQPGLGFNGGYIKIGKETTWGDEAVRTRQLEAESVDLSLSSEPKFVEVIPKQYKTADEIFQGQIDVQGSFTVPTRYEEIEILIEELLGANTITEQTTFEVATGNKYIDFKEDGGGELTATVAEATTIMAESSATADSLCKAIKTALDAAGSGTYTVTFSNTTKKITIAVATGASATQFLWKTGTHGSDNSDDSIAALIGFDDLDGTSVASVIGDNAVVTVFAHALRFSSTITEGLSVEKEIDTNLTTGKAFVYTGCKIDSMAFNVESDGSLKTTINLICKNEELEETPTTGLSTSTSPLVLYQQGVITIDSDISAKVVNFSCEIKRNLSSDRYRFSRYINQPVPIGKADVTGTMTLEFDSDTYYALFLAQTQKTISVKFSGATIKGTDAYEMEFVFNYSYLTAAAVNPTDQGIVMVDIPFDAIGIDSSNREVEINIQNTKSTV